VDIFGKKGGHKERANDGVSVVYVLYPYMKIEE
jgi:hypothetical protein